MLRSKILSCFRSLGLGRMSGALVLIWKSVKTYKKNLSVKASGSPVLYNTVWLKTCVCCVLDWKKTQCKCWAVFLSLPELISCDMLCIHDLHKISFVREYLIILSRMSNLNLILEPIIANFSSAARCQVVNMVLILSLSFGAPDFLHTSDRQPGGGGGTAVTIAWLQWWAFWCTVLSCKEFQGATPRIAQHLWKVLFLLLQLCIATIQCGVHWFGPVSV